MRELLETQEYFLLNNQSMVEGGPWTWFSRADSKVKSCLDLAVISRNLLPFVTKVVIDNQREFTPFRVTRKKSLYTDHLSYKVVLRMPRSKAEKREKETTWNLKKVGGWEAYKMKTDELANRIEEIVDDHDKPIDEVMENVMKVENKIKFAALICNIMLT